MADNRITESSWDLINSWRESNQIVANNMATLLDLNLKFAQTVFLSGIETLEREEETVRNMTQGLQQQSQRQQSAFEQLTQSTTDLYANYFRTLFSFYRSIGENAQRGVQQGIRYAQDATRQTVDTAASTAWQTAERAENNMRQG